MCALRERRRRSIRKMSAARSGRAPRLNSEFTSIALVNRTREGWPIRTLAGGWLHPHTTACQPTGIIIISFFVAVRALRLHAASGNTG
jgi:hypothetical protein